MQFLAEIWTRILRKTDLLTCLSYGDMLAAEPFLVDQQRAMDIAIAADHRIGISLLLRHGIGVLSPDTAARNGNLDLMQRILERGELNDCDGDTFDDVTKRGHLHVLEWFHDNLDLPWCVFRFWLAIRHGHIDIAEWMLRMRSTELDNTGSAPLSADTLQGAIETACGSGQLTMLRWLVQDAVIGYENVLLVDHFLSSAILRASSCGQLEVLDWLEDHINDPGQLRHAIVLASQGQKMGETFYLGPSLFFQTIVGGHLDCLLWLKSHVQDISFSNQRERESVVLQVAVRGDAHMLEWLHNNMDVPFSPHCMDQAAGASIEAVIWFHHNRTEGCTTQAMDIAAAAGLLDVVRWLHANRLEGCTTAAMDGAAMNGNLDVLKWFHENREEGCTANAMDLAAANGHLDVIQWMHSHREEGCSTNAMDEAAANKHMHVVVWLQENRKEGCSDNIIEGMFSAASQANGEADPSILDFLLEHYPEKCQGDPDIFSWYGEDEFYSRAAAALQT